MTLLRSRDDAEHDEPALTLESFLLDPDAMAVRLEAGDDARALIPAFDRLRLVEVVFPTFRDGRGYSAARILRELGYAGELRAVGDVLLDQVVLLRRSGFDALASKAPLDPAKVNEALSRFPFVYQPSVDRRPPAWQLRHG